MVMENLFSGIYKNKTVLVTGHTGFKGSWLVYWLNKMGAKVIGYSLEAPTYPNHIELLDLDITSIIGDIRDLEKLNQTFQKYKPEIVFHLAAQPLVRLSYENPIETYETNVMGTLKVFEASIMDLKDLLKNCIQSRIKIDNLAIFDLEYLFLKIRGASIGEAIEMQVVCRDDGKTKTTAIIDINQVEVNIPEEANNKIMLTDTSGIIMKYPGIDTFIDVNFLDFDIDNQKVFEVMADSIDQIFDGEDIYDDSTTSKKEKIEFIESLTRKQFEQIETFFENIPKLSCTFSAVNPNTGVKSDYTVEGLSNFFG